MSKTYTRELLIGETKVEVEFKYTPAQPACDFDGPSCRPLQPPEDECIEVISAKVVNEDELAAEIQEHWQSELIELI